VSVARRGSLVAYESGRVPQLGSGEAVTSPEPIPLFFMFNEQRALRSVFLCLTRVGCVGSKNLYTKSTGRRLLFCVEIVVRPSFQGEKL
jgi:hypothetical protein